MTESKHDLSPVVVVGAGAAGSVLTRALHDIGIRVSHVISRTPESAHRLAEAVGADTASDRLVDVREMPKLLVLSVPDDQIPVMARRLANIDLEWEGCTAMHMSGALSSAVLKPLQDRGAETMSFHPMISLHVDSPTDVLKGAWINIEGARDATVIGQSMADQVGARGHIVSARDKAVIHVVASLASNYVVTLLSLAVDLLGSTGIDQSEYDALLRPLLSGTISNVDFEDPGEALTGPISRGDQQTVRAHLDILRDLAPELIPVVSSLAAETVRLAVQHGRITDIVASELLNLVEEAVDSTLSRD